MTPALASCLERLTEINQDDSYSGAEGPFVVQGQDPKVIGRTKNLMRVLAGLMLFATSGMPQVICQSSLSYIQLFFLVYYPETQRRHPMAA